MLILKRNLTIFQSAERAWVAHKVAQSTPCTFMKQLPIRFKTGTAEQGKVNGISDSRHKT